MVQWNIGNANRIGNALFIILEPGTFAPQRIAPALLFGRRASFTPGTLSLARRKALDGTLHCLAPLEHHQMTRDANVRLFRAGDGGRDLLEAGALEHTVAVAADDESRYIQLAELLPAVPPRHILEVELFQDLRRRKQPFTREGLDGS